MTTASATSSVRATQIRPRPERLLVRRLKKAEKTGGGIYLPETAQAISQMGVVIAAGEKMGDDIRLRSIAERLEGVFDGLNVLHDEVHDGWHDGCLLCRVRGDVAAATFDLRDYQKKHDAEIPVGSWIIFSVYAATPCVATSEDWDEDLLFVREHDVLAIVEEDEKAEA